MPDSVTKAVRQLTDIGVRRLEHLEVLIVLCRQPGRDWDADQIAGASTIPRATAADALAHLHRHDLLRQVDAARATYRLSDRPELAALAEVRKAFERDRVHVMNVFFACNLDSLRSFADAFRMRRKD